MHALDDFLGDFATQMTEERKGELARAFELIDARYPLDADGQDDYAEERAEAQSSAAMLAFEDATLDEKVAEWRAAVAAERRAMAALTGAISFASQSMSENAIATEHDLNRQTVRKALGK